MLSLSSPNAFKQMPTSRPALSGQCSPSIMETTSKSNLSQKIKNDNDHRSDGHVCKTSKGGADAEVFSDDDITEILTGLKSDSDSEGGNSESL